MTQADSFEIWPFTVPGVCVLSLDEDDPTRIDVMKDGKRLFGVPVPDRASDPAQVIDLELGRWLDDYPGLYGDADFDAWAMRTVESAEAERERRVAAYNRDLAADGWAKGSEIEPRQIDFLIRPYIPLGYPTLLAGDPGVGKSKMSLAIAAGVTRGVYGEARNVLIMSVEDDHEASIAPMLIKLGADMERVHILPIEKAFVLDDAGWEKLDRALVKFDPLLVIIDPMTYFLGDKKDMHRANEVRSVMTKLGARAAKHKNVMLPIMHVNKGQGTKLLYKILGSIDFAASVRSALVVGKIDDEPERGRVIIHAKTNAAKEGEPLGFDLTEDPNDPDGAPIFKWREKTDITRAELEGSKPGRKPSQSKLCKDIVVAMLASGPLDSKVVKAAVTGAGVSDATLRRVREEIIDVEQVVGPGRGGSSSLWKLKPLAEEWNIDNDMIGWARGENEQVKG